MAEDQGTEPDHTAVRVALWRALHTEVDAPPHVLEDTVGLRLADPPDGWRDRPGWVMSENGARSSGTPFLSFFAPGEFLDLARAAGFAGVRHVSGREMNERYFGGRPDGLRMSTGEDFLIATS